MASKKNTQSSNDMRVEVFVQRAGERADPNEQITINGKTYLLPRGKKSLVPPEVAEEYERKLRAEEAWHETRGAIKKAAKAPEG